MSYNIKEFQYSVSQKVYGLFDRFQPSGGIKDKSPALDSLQEHLVGQGATVSRVDGHLEVEVDSFAFIIKPQPKNGRQVGEGYIEAKLKTADPRQMKRVKTYLSGYCGPFR